MSEKSEFSWRAESQNGEDGRWLSKTTQVSCRDRKKERQRDQGADFALREATIHSEKAQGTTVLSVGK